MDELAELQALLGAVQKQESKNRLNERNCRELLLKLIEKELVTLIVTLDGNEYVTPEQLERELKDEIIVRGGRCNLTDVQPTLNVDLRHVQNRMDDILKEDPSIVFIEGEVFTQEYLDGMAEETNQVLAEAGSLRLVDLASRFNITTQFLIECIKPRMGTIVQGRMEAGMLYTPTYVERQEACVRGAFSAVTRPTAVATLQQAFNLDESLFESTIDGLIKRGRLAGTLSGKGMRASFNPASFSKAQLAAVRGFYEANGYIEYTTAEKMLVNNPKGFLSKELGASGFALRTCYASLSLVQQVEAQVEEALASGTLIDVQPLLPPFMDGADASEVLRRCEAVQRDKSARMMADSCVVSGKWLDKCMEFVKQRAAADADRLSKELGVGAGADAAGAEDEDDGGGRKGKKGARRGDDEDEDEDAGRKGKGNKRQEMKEAAAKAKEKKGGKGGGKGDDAKGGKGGAGCGAKGAARFDYDAETEKHLGAMLQASGEEVGEELLPELVVALRGRAKDAYHEAASSVFSSKAQTRAKRDALQGHFLGLFQSFAVFRKGAALLPAETQPQLEKFLVKSVGADMVNLVMADQAEVAGVPLPEGGVTSVEHREALLGSLPAAARGPLQALNAALACGGKAPAADLERALEAAAPAVGIECKLPDKNQERGMVFVVRQQWAEQLKSEEQPPVVLLLTLQLLCLHCLKLPVSAPGRAAPALLEAIKGSLTPEAHDRLAALIAAVQRMLAPDDEDAGRDARLEAISLMEGVRAMGSSKEGMAGACVAQS